MSLRLDLTLDPRGVARAVGFVAAADADEDHLVELLHRFQAAGALVGATMHGPASTGCEVRPEHASPAGTEAASWELTTTHERAWRDVICWALQECAVLELALAWETRYDRSGSVDDGRDEWRTSWSDAPTEGDGVDSDWP